MVNPAGDPASFRGPLELAYIGDCVYELFVRTHLIEKAPARTGALHRAAVRIVSAPAQAAAAKAIFPLLSPEEQEMFQRGRNAKTHGCPQGCTSEEYSYATALEALFGWLYLQKNTERLSSLFRQCLDAALAMTTKL